MWWQQTVHTIPPRVEDSCQVVGSPESTPPRVEGLEVILTKGIVEVLPPVRGEGKKHMLGLGDV